MASRKKAQEPQAVEPIKTYGYEWREGYTQLDYDRAAFADRIPVGEGAPPRYELLLRIMAALTPWVDINPWTERALRALCDNTVLSFPGCGAAGKTFSVALFGCLWWLAAPESSAVIMTSTTKEMIRKRGWPVVQQVFSKLEVPVGNFVDSKTKWQAVRGDDFRSVCAVAVADGETQKAMGKIQGVHPKRLLIAVDEAEQTPEAIAQVCANLSIGCEDFQFVQLCNPASYFGWSGKMCEPRNGWQSVSLETQEWETRKSINGVPGWVVRFDAAKSPNVLAGKDLFPYLMRCRDYENAIKEQGLTSPSFWMYYRGYWPPESNDQTIMTESFVTMHKIQDETHVFIGGDVEWIASFDPSFTVGGDNAVIYVGRMGTIRGGGKGIEVVRRVKVVIDAADKRTPATYQLARKAIAICRENNVEPDHFCIDNGHNGQGVADIMATEWSMRIVRFNFGGRADEKSISMEDHRQAKDVYYNKSAAMAFRVCQFAKLGQLRGVPEQAVKDFTERRWRHRENKIEVEPKKEMKPRLGRSPDDGDALTLMVALAEQLGAEPNDAAVEVKREAKSDWNKSVRQFDEVYTSQGYGPEEMGEEDEEVLFA